MVKYSNAGRPVKWPCQMVITTIYIPSDFQGLIEELGYGSSSEALYGLLRAQVFQDNSGNGNGSFERYRTLFNEIENTRKAVTHTQDEKAISDETKSAVLNEYLKGLLPQQARSLKSAAQSTNLDKLTRYQQAIEERTGIWIEPKIFFQRFPAEVESK